MARLCKTQETFGVPPHEAPWPDGCRICGRLALPGEEGDHYREQFGEPDFPIWPTRPASLDSGPATGTPITRLRPAMAGPGTQLSGLIAMLGLGKDRMLCESCRSLASQMDNWGLDGCKEHREEILVQLRAAYGRLGWLEAIRAGALAVKAGLGFAFNPIDPAPGLLEEALRRASAAPQIIQVFMGSQGIGDALLCLTAVAGVKRDNPRAHVVYSVRPWSRPWAMLFEGADEVLGGEIDQEQVTTYRPYDTYGAENHNRLQDKPRWAYYADACHTEAVLPRARPLPHQATSWAEPYRGAVVFAPWSHYQNRQWMLSHWLFLERLLAERGFRVVTLDGRQGRARDRSQPFGESLVDLPAPMVASLMTVSACVVGNDSAMAHLAGLLQVPTVVLGAPVKVERIFGVYPTVRGIDGPLGCSGCHWGGRDWRRACDTVCASLQAIQPPDVADAVERQAVSPCASLANLDADRLVSLTRAVRAAKDVPGDLAELGVYKGGSALAMCRADAGKTLHAFDTFAGLPADCPEGVHRRGEFAAPLDEVKTTLTGRKVEYHAGVFPAPAREVSDARYSVVHIDADLYTSTREAVAYFWPRLSPGGLLVFDDWLWPDTPGVERAVREVFKEGQIEQTAPYQCRVRKEG